MIKKISDFDNQVLKNSKLTLVDFYADWCGPCRAQTPILDNLSNEYDWFDVMSLDVDTNQEQAFKYGIQSIPTILIFKEGKPVKTIIGLTGIENIIKILEDFK